MYIKPLFLKHSTMSLVPTSIVSCNESKTIIKLIKIIFVRVQLVCSK